MMMMTRIMMMGVNDDGRSCDDDGRRMRDVSVRLECARIDVGARKSN